MIGPMETRKAVPQSVLDAIKMGIWDYEPELDEAPQFDATEALPGTEEKLSVLAHRVQAGLPLWHPCDRRTFDGRPLGPPPRPDE